MYELCDGMHPGSYFVAIDCGEEQMEAGKTGCEGTQNGISGGRNDAMQPVVMLVIARGGNVFRDWRRVTSVALLYIKRNQRAGLSGTVSMERQDLPRKRNRRNLCAGAL